MYIVLNREKGRNANMKTTCTPMRCIRKGKNSEIANLQVVNEVFSGVAKKILKRRCSNAVDVKVEVYCMIHVELNGNLGMIATKEIKIWLGNLTIGMQNWEECNEESDFRVANGS